MAGKDSDRQIFRQAMLRQTMLKQAMLRQATCVCRASGQNYRLAA
jgi:hypothetical protein